MNTEHILLSGQRTAQIEWYSKPHWRGEEVATAYRHKARIEGAKEFPELDYPDGMRAWATKHPDEDVEITSTGTIHSIHFLSISYNREACQLTADDLRLLAEAYARINAHKEVTMASEWEKF